MIASVVAPQGTDLSAPAESKNAAELEPSAEWLMLP
jgi:hypothetical protein